MILGIFWLSIAGMFVLKRLEDERDRLDRIIEDIKMASYEEDLRLRSALQRRLAALEERM